MRVLVCGGRDFDNADWLYDVLDGLSQKVSLLISGCAAGADSIALAWADERGIQAAPFPADWAKHGRKAGPIRNQRMLEEGRPDIVIAFPGSRGTADMVRRARAAGVKVMQFSGFPRDVSKA